MNKFLIASGFAASVLVASPAFAEPAEVERVMVSTAGIDLARPSGVRELDRRVESAAALICDVKQLHDDTDPVMIDRCLAQVKSRVRGQVQAQIAEARKAADRSVELASRR